MFVSWVGFSSVCIHRKCYDGKFHNWPTTYIPPWVQEPISANQLGTIIQKNFGYIFIHKIIIKPYSSIFLQSLPGTFTSIISFDLSAKVKHIK